MGAFCWVAECPLPPSASCVTERVSGSIRDDGAKFLTEEGHCALADLGVSLPEADNSERLAEVRTWGSSTARRCSGGHSRPHANRLSICCQRTVARCC